MGREKQGSASRLLHAIFIALILLGTIDLLYAAIGSVLTGKQIYRERLLLAGAEHFGNPSRAQNSRRTIERLEARRYAPHAWIGLHLAVLGVAGLLGTRELHSAA